MRVLVAGATGNVGVEAMLYCHNHDYEVVGLARHGMSMKNVYEVDLAWKTGVNAVIGKPGVYDLVIMAQGVQETCTLEDMTVGTWQRVIDGNLTSAMYLTTVLMEYSSLANNALIVYFSSIQATNPRAGRAAYAVAKAGVEALCRVAAVELAPNTRTACLRLGQLTTTMRGVKFDDAQLAALQARSPLPWVKPAAVAKMCFDLYEQPGLTGAVIDLSAGHTLNIW